MIIYLRFAFEISNFKSRLDNTQVYLGGYQNEEHAAEAYDVAALKTKGLKVRG